MRIISGSHKGRTIKAPGNLPVRPTTDFAKESLFNIIHNHFDFNDLTVLDLFSGTGNITYEFASRGARKITAVDANYKCFSFIEKTVADLDFNQVHPVKADVFTYLKLRPGTGYDIIFADPPYGHEKINMIPELVFEHKLLNEHGWLIVEHDDRTELSKKEQLLEVRKYGKVHFSIYAVK